MEKSDVLEIEGRPGVEIWFSAEKSEKAAGMHAGSG
jgi:hypothetical protein